MQRNQAFTLIELLTVVGIIALLMALFMPALQRAREQGKRAACLANLREIAAAAHSYATEDSRELIIPIHQRMIRGMPPEDYWLWRCAMWFSYGGRSATDAFLTGMGERWLDAKSDWAGATRPLNRHLFRNGATDDGPELKLFRCPSDRGYPDSPLIDDSPLENADRPCFETLGNSYRASLYCILPGPGAAYDGAFAVGPWGHRLSTITEPSRVGLFGEPTFFNMIGQDNGIADPDPVVALGWHGTMMQDNLSFCDGSARVTIAAGRRTAGEEAGRELLNVGENWHLISRGPTWRFDLWPTPGARIWAADPANLFWNPPYTAQPDERWRWWPFVAAQNNLTD